VAEEEKTFSVSEDVVTAPCSCLFCETPREFLSTLDFEANESCHLLVTGDKLIQHCQNQCQTATQLRKFHEAFIKKMVADSSGAYRLHDVLIFPYERWLIRYGERLEDLIAYVLEDRGEPMPFREIGAAIRKENIKYREISDHNVHAAVMRYDSIEIIQRGTYGLKAWGAGGYRSVSTAIEELLGAHDLPMRRSEIIKQLEGEFSEQNISAALHNRSRRFESIGEGFYDRPERWRKRSVAGLIEMLSKPLTDLARFVTTNNNCSYKMVLALVFFRGMDDKGSFYLPSLKERFYNFYLSRQKKGEVVEAKNVIMRQIGELEAAGIINKTTKEPLKSFLNSGFWQLKRSSLYLKNDFVPILAEPGVQSLLLITLLKGVDDYFAVFVPQPDPYPIVGDKVVQETRDSFSKPGVSGAESLDSFDDSVITISIKKKSRGKIAL